MELKEISESQFSEFASKCEANNFLQSVEMYHRYLDMNKETYLVGLFDGGKMKSAALLVSKRSIRGQKIFNSPRGFLMDYSAKDALQIFAEMTKKTKEFLKQKKAMSLVVAPNFGHVIETDEKTGEIIRKPWEKGEEFNAVAKKLGYKSLGEYEFVKWLYTLPSKDVLEDKAIEKLPIEKDKVTTEDLVFAHLRSGHRYSVKLTRRYGVKLRKLAYDELNVLDDIVHESGIKHGFPDPGLEYYQQMYKAYGDKIEFVVAEVSKDVVKAAENNDREAIEKARLKAEKGKVEMVPVAAAMFVFWENETIYLYSGSRGEYKKFSGPFLIQMEMIRRTIEKNVPMYNFYGLLPFPGDGVYEFKRGFHGQLEELVGTYMLPITPLGKIFAMKQKYKETRDIH